MLAAFAEVNTFDITTDIDAANHAGPIVEWPGATLPMKCGQELRLAGDLYLLGKIEGGGRAKHPTRVQ
jgi:hypothetical protein